MEGTLNFFDDPTHVKIYSIAEISNILLAANFKILNLGVRRDVLRMLLTPFIFLYLKYIKKLPAAGAFCDITGSANFIFARKG
jgi:hypothetical protein